MTKNYHQAMDLMLEDLYTVHSKIREQAKMLNCEQELIEIRENIVEYLKSKK